MMMVAMKVLKTHTFTSMLSPVHTGAGTGLSRRIRRQVVTVFGSRQCGQGFKDTEVANVDGELWAPLRGDSKQPWLKMKMAGTYAGPCFRGRFGEQLIARLPPYCLIIKSDAKKYLESVHPFRNYRLTFKQCETSRIHHASTKFGEYVAYDSRSTVRRSCNVRLIAFCECVRAGTVKYFGPSHMREHCKYVNTRVCLINVK